MTWERIFALLLVMVLCIACIDASALTKKRSTELSGLYESNDVPEKEVAPEEVNSRLIMRLLDAALEHARLNGASPAYLRDMMRKRDGIRRCFFHAVNCW